jgi:large subunit ribosomal protein L7/L12
MTEGNGTSFAPDIMELGDKIAALTITKAVQLRDYLKEKYKIEPAAGGVVMAPGPGGAAGAPAEAKPEEKTEFTVVLEGLADPAKKINVIKVVREITNLGLKEAKELVEGAPKPVKENVSKDEANTIKKKLEDGGAKVSLK